ncbi:MAG: TlpA family protein disulfide reductase [Opitutaceae bacterium]|nr:TlpA family protein disulfide reductase [Opitutaceae bacterium]
MLAICLLGLTAAFSGCRKKQDLPPPAPATEPAPAKTAEPAPKSQADLDYEAVFALWRTPAPEGLEPKDPAFWEFQDQIMRKFAAAGRAFAEKYPADPRRYNCWVQSSFTRPWFLTGFKPEFATAPRETNLIVDAAALAAYRVEQAKLLTIVIESPDADSRQRGGAFFALLADARGVARTTGQAFDITVYRPLVDRVLATLGDERVMPVVEQYVSGLRQQSPEAAAAYEAALQSNPAIASALQVAVEKQKAEAAQAADAAKVRAAEIGSMKFTAADGRAVDVAALKGKVVLVDFWATWCGPCIAELPNVKKVYADFHDKGFEVIGITLENPGLRGKETPAEMETKLAAAKKKMLDFTVKQEMPWPQYFDGKWWKNDYAVKFGIQSIPAMFLLDKEGRIAATDARGEKLESEVKRLLGL